MDPVFHWVIVAGSSLLFAAGVVEKLRDPRRFVAAVRAYRLLPSPVVSAAAGAIMLTEAALALAVWTDAWQRQALGSMAALLSVYWLAIAINLKRGRRDIDCGCSGPAMRQTLSGGLLVRNALLVVLVLAAALGGPAVRELIWLDYLSIGAGVAMAVLMYASANRLLAQAPRLAMLRGG